MKLDIEAELKRMADCQCHQCEVRREALTRLKRIGELAKIVDDQTFGEPPQYLKEILRLCGVNHEEA